jgi:anti-anti-sigma factor
MGEALTIRVRRDRGYAIVAVAGEVDIATVTRLRERLFELAASGRTLVVDLDQVSFIDSAGLAALVGAARRAAALDLSRSRGEVSTSLTCAVPSHAVLVTAMVTTPSAITLGKALRLACLTRVHQSHAGATCLAGAHAYPPPGRLAGRGGALKNCSVASAIQLQ